MPSSERFNLLIEKMVAGGFGLGRHEGQVVFVPESAPGDRLLVEPFERRRDFLRAQAVELLEASPMRREPPCPYFATCGGCSMMHLQVEAQAEAKRQILLESLRRGGGVAFSGQVPVLTGPEMGYRLKARFHVKRTRRGLVVGFKARGSHRLVDVERCLQISERSNDLLMLVREWLASRPQRAVGLVAFEVLEPVAQTIGEHPDSSPVTEGPSAKRREVIHFVVNKSKHPVGRELAGLAEKAGLAGVVVSRDEPEVGAPVVYRLGKRGVIHRVAGFELQSSVGSFFQANRYLLDALVSAVVPTDRPGLTCAVDLYCGVGLFSLPLARCSDRVVGVEISSSAVADARANARRAGVANVFFRNEGAAHYASREGFESVDLVVADPPRGGLEGPVLEELCRRSPKEVRYVSCDPASLGRDAGRLQKGGLVLDRLVLLDLFPNTHHIESVATFRQDTGRPS